jgi:uncharacterized protein YbjT (DUF2867 family)
LQYHFILNTLFSKYFTFCKYKYTFALSNKQINMNIILTGSIGHISKPLAQSLIKAGHNVSIISSKKENTEAIEAIGAKALIGSVESGDFITQAFQGADAVYLMIPPSWNVSDWLLYQKNVSHNFVNAITANNITKAVVLSSIGAHMINGAGPIDGLAYLEGLINQLPEVNAIYLRPSYFFYNFFSMIPLIKANGFMGSNMPESHNIILTHTNDIVENAINAFNSELAGKKVVYIASDERKLSEVAQTLGTAVGLPDLHWVEFTDEQNLGGLLQAGLPETIAQGYTTMGKAMRSNEMEADYQLNKPAQLGKVKLEDFAKEFAAAYLHA